MKAATGLVALTEFLIEAVKFLTKQRIPPAGIRRLDVPYQALHNWVTLAKHQVRNFGCVTSRAR